MTKVKICGIRTPVEAEFLNQFSVDYAGVVLYEKSKRYVPIEKTKEILDKLNQNIIKVAVAVSPEEKMMQKVFREGFDVLQIHGDYDRKLLEYKPDRLKLWRAVNIRKPEELAYFDWEEAKAFDAILLDAEKYGSGQTFGWDSGQNQAGEDVGRQIKQTMTQAENTKGQIEMLQKFRETLKAHGISFVLAGGLCADNVREGIRIFEPDIVDVSSGVENEHGKDEEKIRIFVEKVKN